MKQNTKKVIAKEILILSTIIVIAPIIYGVLNLLANYNKKAFEKLKKQETSITAKIRQKENKYTSEYGSFIKKTNVELRKLYDKINHEYNIGTFDEYIFKMYKSEKRKILYEALKKEYDLGTYEEFEDNLGFNSHYRTPNDSIVKAKVLMEKYGIRFDSLIEQKVLTLVEKTNIIRDKNHPITSKKHSDFEQIEQLKKERIDIIKKIQNNNYYININDLFFSILLGILILVYPFRYFILVVKWSIKTVNN